MTRYEWLLLLHLIGAFASMGSVVVFSVLLAGGARVAGSAAHLPGPPALGRGRPAHAGLRRLAGARRGRLRPPRRLDPHRVRALGDRRRPPASGSASSYSEATSRRSGSVVPLYAVMAVCGHRPARRDDLQARRMTSRASAPTTGTSRCCCTCSARWCSWACSRDRRDPRGRAARPTTGRRRCGSRSARSSRRPPVLHRHARGCRVGGLGGERGRGRRVDRHRLHRHRHGPAAPDRA